MYSEQKQALAETQALKRPAVLAVSGVHNSGKTTLLEKLLPVLRSRGLKVGVIKHDGHDFTPEGSKSSGWPKIEVVRSAISDAPVSFQPLAVVGDIPGADFDLNDIPALADWIEAQMPAL